MHTDITGTWSMDYVNPLFNILLEIKKQLGRLTIFSCLCFSRHNIDFFNKVNH